jgi:anti-anti-sigma factor
MQREDLGDRTIITLTEGTLYLEGDPPPGGPDASYATRELFEGLLKEGRRRVYVDFRQLRHITTTTFGFFVGFRKKVQEAGGELVMCNLPPEIYDALEPSWLDKFFDIRQDFDPRAMRGDS